MICECEVRHEFRADKRTKGVILGFVYGEYRDRNSYPSPSMLKGTLAVVVVDGEAQEVPLHLLIFKSNQSSTTMEHSTTTE